MSLNNPQGVPHSIPLVFSNTWLIFPSRFSQNIELVSADTEKRDKEKIQDEVVQNIERSRYFAVAFFMPKEGTVRVGVLCRLDRVERKEGALTLYFRALSRIYITEAMQNVRGSSSTKWKHFNEIPIQTEGTRSPEFNEDLESLKFFFRAHQKALKNMSEPLYDSIFPREKLLQIYGDFNHPKGSNLTNLLDEIIAGIAPLLALESLDEEIRIKNISLFYAILSEESVHIRLKRVCELLLIYTQSLTVDPFAEEIKILDSLNHIRSKLDEVAGKNRNTEEDYRKRYEEKKKSESLSEEVCAEIERELGRLERSGQSSETERIVEHLEWLLEVPFNILTKDTENFADVKRMLNEDHAGLEKVKERILEYLAVRKLNPSAKSPILCFVGPPGVGKTSLGESIARALGRKFIRWSLGGMRDETDIRGHGGTYVNALPGQIVQKLRRAKTSNPVFMLDEGDKVGHDWRGDPSSALLEVLDPEQNNTFLDRYLNVPLDLSLVFFIVTANIVDTMQPALLDRMEVIELPGYTPLEKLDIAKNYLVPRRRVENGFPIEFFEDRKIDLSFTGGAILKLIYRYTGEAGVRQLEKMIDRVFRKIALSAQLKDEALGKRIPTDGVFKIREQNIHKYCGKPFFVEHVIPDVLKPGVVPALATSAVGGSIDQIEVSLNRHYLERKIKLIGVRASHKDKEEVNKIEESFQIAFEALTSQGELLFDELKKLEKDLGGPLFIQGSITEGWIPKDGPSGGVPLFFALYGKISGKSIKPNPETPLLAATGVITQNLGTIHAVGGIRDKVLAADRAGVGVVIIPKENEADTEDIPVEVRKRVKILPLSSMWVALYCVFWNGGEFLKKISQMNSAALKDYVENLNRMEDSKVLDLLKKEFKRGS
ncbi:AAA family ATPase [Patescibacteria group bacterium]|nr:AAA family ATPase [Patescibacteria group bacterium]